MLGVLRELFCLRLVGAIVIVPIPRLLTYPFESRSKHAGGKRETRGATEAAMLHTTMLDALDEMQSSRGGRPLQELGAEMSSEQLAQLVHGFLGVQGRAEALAGQLPETSRAALFLPLSDAAPEDVELEADEQDEQEEGDDADECAPAGRAGWAGTGEFAGRRGAVGRVV